MKKPQTGIGSFILNSTEDKILISKRIKEQKYQIPGGSLEHGETIEACAKRELFEETNIKIEDTERLRIIGCKNCINLELDYHWIDFYTATVLTEDEEKTVSNPEKEKCEDWIWVDYNELIKLKESLFFPLQYFLDAYNIKSFKDILSLKYVD